MLRMESPPVIRDNRTLVPLRAVFEALGATVEWNAATQTITGRKGNTVVVLGINDPNATVDTKSGACPISRRISQAAFFDDFLIRLQERVPPPFHPTGL